MNYKENTWYIVENVEVSGSFDPVLYSKGMFYMFVMNMGKPCILRWLADGFDYDSGYVIRGVIEQDKGYVPYIKKENEHGLIA
jgi:hypothetical protein